MAPANEGAFARIGREDDRVTVGDCGCHDALPEGVREILASHAA